MNHFLLFLGAGILAGQPASAAEKVPITVSGRNFAPQTQSQKVDPDHPLYYLGIFRNFKDFGKDWGHSDPERGPRLSDESVRQKIGEALAATGYLPFQEPAPGQDQGGSAPGGPKHPALILDFSWGYINSMESIARPRTRRFRALMQSSEAQTQEAFMLDLLGKKDVPEKYGAVQDVEANRYYLVVAAYDYAAFAEHKQRVLLWRTKMSAPADNSSLAATLPGMLEVGTTVLGQNLVEPVFSSVLPGNVTVGQPKVLPAPSR